MANTYSKFVPNVFLAKCTEKHEPITLSHLISFKDDYIRKQKEYELIKKEQLINETIDLINAKIRQNTETLLSCGLAHITTKLDYYEDDLIKVFEDAGFRLNYYAPHSILLIETIK